MLVAPSGWVENGEKLYSKGDFPIHEGDIVVEGDQTSLVCRNLTRYPFFRELVPITDWVGRRIVTIEPIRNARMIFPPGQSLTDKNQVFVMRFDDRLTSAFFVEGSQMVSVFEDNNAPNIDLMIEAGILSADDGHKRAAEYALDESLRSRKEELTTRRSELQQSLANADLKEGHKTYHEIRSIERELEGIQKTRDNYPWDWVRYVFDLHYMTRRLPTLVDLFDWKSGPQFMGRDTGELLNPQGRLIGAVHKVYDASDTQHDSRDVFMLEFEDGSFSTPVGICSDISVEFSITGLLGAGLMARALDHVIAARLTAHERQIKEKKAALERLHQLRKELERHDLGERKTRQIVREIRILERQ